MGAELLAWLFVLPAAAGPPSFVPYQGPGILLEVELLDAQGQRVALPLRLDTGSTLTTMSAEALERLGIVVPADAPVVVASTASGMRQSHLLLLEHLWVGGHEVHPVTVAVCDECADPDSAGLLGLNVLDRFATIIDPRLQRLAFTPLEDGAGHRTDVGAWAGLIASVRAKDSGEGEVEVGVASDAPRPIEEVRLRVRCGVELEVGVGPVPAGGTVKKTIAVPAGLTCPELELTVIDARWAR